jgi:Ca2+/Na+ antiporter
LYRYAWVPDALSSIGVAKGGQGDMAVANAVGSNVFDIWLGLGLPWTVFLPSRGGYEEAGLALFISGSLASSSFLLALCLFLNFLLSFLAFWLVLSSHTHTHTFHNVIVVSKHIRLMTAGMGPM